MDILEILKFDMYDILKFYTGLIHNDIETTATSFSIKYHDRIKFTTFLEIRYDGLVIFDIYNTIPTYRNISEYLIYLRDKKLNTLLDDNN